VPLLLRKIRKSKWYKSDAVPWLEEGELQADSLVDLATKGNRLSVYLVDDDHENLEQIVTALAAACDYISDFEFALFNEEAVHGTSIKVEETAGDTPDPVVNTWHRDLSELTANKVIALATVISTQAVRKRLLSRRVLELLVDAVVSRQLDRAKVRLNSESLAKIDKLVESKTT
jgi:hypothetical protein